MYHKMFYSLCDSEGSFLPWEITFREAEAGMPAGFLWYTSNIAGLQWEPAKEKELAAPEGI